MPSKLLIIEPTRGSLVPAEIFAQACCESASWDTFAADNLHRFQAQLILADASSHEDKEGKAVLFFHWLRKNPVGIPIVAILPELATPELTSLVAEVADDFLLSPVRGNELALRIDRILGAESNAPERARQALGVELGLAQLVGRHPAFLQVVSQIPVFAKSDAPLLITGETGTGKELFAQALHSLSPRRNGAFIPVDCAALPEQLAENELFGHRRGAFTDAHTDQKGLAAMAEGGTLFLDEIDALSLPNQAKLLRLLQERCYRALGSDHFMRANVRIIAATNQCIETCVRQRRFREDLYFRLNVLRLRVCPLRDRLSDVQVLAKHFLNLECRAGRGERKVFSPAALRKLECYSWPGNVRELFSIVQRAVLCCTGRQILPEHILVQSIPLPARERGPDYNFREAKRHAVENFERSYIGELLTKHQGNVSRAARAAGKERRSFGRLVKKYGMTPRSTDSQTDSRRQSGAGLAQPVG
jgi:two-component system, NtrC family, response regulator GlrR